LLAVLSHDGGGRFQPNAGGIAFVDEGALCGEPPAARGYGASRTASP
jgi:hypothetical protein